MARRKSAKPREIITPEERAANRMEANRLKAVGAEVTTDLAGRIVRARRVDVFQLLHERGAAPGRLRSGRCDGGLQRNPRRHQESEGPMTTGMSTSGR